MIPYSTQWIEEDDIAAVAEVMRGGFLTQGPTIEKFEKAFAQYLGVKHVVAVASGTAALHLGVLAMRKLWGEEVSVRGFVPPMTFAASLNCFWYANANASLVDVDPKTGLMTPETLELALKNTPREKNEKWIVVPVSMDGRPFDAAGLKAVADKYDAVILEDVARAVGGSYKADGKKFKMGACEHSHAAIASFHSIKQLCLGEGGALMTNDDALAAKVRLLRSHAIVRPGRKEDPAWHYEQVDLGFHYRITDMQCALGLSQLRKLDQRNEKRHARALRYDNIFSQAPFKGKVWSVPSNNEVGEGHAHHLYILHFQTSAIRDAALDFLKQKNISTQVQLPLYKFPYQQKRLGKIELPGAEAYSSGMLFIPLFAQMTDDQQNTVVEALAEFLKAVDAAQDIQLTSHVEAKKSSQVAQEINR